MRLSATFRTAAIGGLVLIAAARTPAAAPCGPAANPGVLAGPFCIGDNSSTTLQPASGVSGQTNVADPQSSSGGAKELGPINGSTTKVFNINSAPLPMMGFTSQPGKTDLVRVSTQVSKDQTTGHLWYYFAWQRAANTGSGFIAIELEKNPLNLPNETPCVYPSAAAQGNANDPATIAFENNCNPWRNRSDGDIMISWPQTGNTANQIEVQKWCSANCGTPAPTWGPFVTSTTAVTAFCPNGFCGEAAIDLTVDVFPAGGACESFANTLPNTVTGSTLEFQANADYKDTVLFPFPAITNCGTVTVTKVTQPSGQTGSFPYTLTAPGGIFNTAQDVGTQCAGSGTSQTTCQNTLTQDGDSNTINNLIAKSGYTLTEGSIGSSFAEVSVVCTQDGSTYTLFDSTGGTTVASFPVVAGATTACVITNKKQTGDLQIIKVVQNNFGLANDPGDFFYAIDGTTTRYFTNTGASKPNGGTACTSGSVCFSQTFSVGSTHSVVETGPLPGYAVTYSNNLNANADCNNLGISAATTAVCTVTNTAQQNPPTVFTFQRVLLFDRATVSVLRRTATDAGTMSVTFNVYPDLASCTAESGSLGSETVTLASGNFNPTDPTQATVGTAGNPAIEIKLDTVGDNGGVPRYWRALFHQTGTNPPNTDKKTDCTEITTVRLQQ